MKKFLGRTGGELSKMSSFPKAVNNRMYMKDIADKKGLFIMSQNNVMNHDSTFKNMVTNGKNDPYFRMQLGDVAKMLKRAEEEGKNGEVECIVVGFPYSSKDRAIALQEAKDEGRISEASEDVLGSVISNNEQCISQSSVSKLGEEGRLIKFFIVDGRLEWHVILDSVVLNAEYMSLIARGCLIVRIVVYIMKIVVLTIERKTKVPMVVSRQVIALLNRVLLWSGVYRITSLSLCIGISSILLVNDVMGDRGLLALGLILVYGIKMIDSLGIKARLERLVLDLTRDIRESGWRGVVRRGIELGIAKVNILKFYKLNLKIIKEDGK